MALTIALWLLAAAFAVLLMAFVFPLRLELRAQVGDAVRYTLRLCPFGTVGPRLTIADSDKPSRKRQSKPREKRSNAPRIACRDPWAVVRAASRLIVEIASEVRIHNAALDLRFGTSDPAETGQIFGALTPLIYGGRCVELSVEPVFDAAVFDVRAAVDVTVTPARLLPAFLRFGWAVVGPGR